MRPAPVLPRTGPALALVLPAALWGLWLVWDTAWPSPLALLPALAVYVAAHGLRLLRMLVLLGDRSPSLRDLAVVHGTTAVVSGQVPFKLGELARWWALGRASRGLDDGLKAGWMERAVDAVLLAAMGLVLGLAEPAVRAAVLPITLASLVLIGLTAILLRLAPEALRNAKRFLIRRYTTEWSLRALATLDAVGRWLDDARAMVHGRLATLILLTLGLWTLELVVVWLLLPSPPGRSAAASLVGVLAPLSAVLGASPDAVPPGLPRVHLLGQLLLIALVTPLAVRSTGQETAR